MFYSVLEKMSNREEVHTNNSSEKKNKIDEVNKKIINVCEKNINNSLLWTNNNCLNCGREKNFICLKCNDVRPIANSINLPYCLLCLNPDLNLNDVLEGNQKCFENMMKQILHICKTHKNN